MIDHDQLLDHLSIGATVIDRDLRVVLWNRWMREHSTFSPAEVKGRKLQEIFPELQKKGLIKKAREVFKKGKPVFFSNKVHQHMFPFHSARSYLEEELTPMEQTVIISPLKDGDGDTEHVLLSIFDVSDWITNQNELLRSKAELELLSQTDDLTQIANRRNILDRLSEELVVHKRKKRPMSVALIDIDHFKEINDTYGHQCGDMILHDLAQFITGLLRDYDTLGRYGGEEFLLILPETNGEQAFRICDRIRQAAQDKTHVYNGQQFQAMLSIGVATMKEGETPSPEKLFKEADRCLYIAKKTGRNRTEVKDQ
ncbi:MAG: GGDEF domain-containing protein [Proteobacteria bacterium]|nr:GGDEF domain-containing protein [Pseudomonadota bacterium]MBU1739405.1 GGDEF domain-containing protein [Pseudomonadota bacterium]